MQQQLISLLPSGKGSAEAYAAQDYLQHVGCHTPVCLSVLSMIALSMIALSMIALSMTALRRFDGSHYCLHIDPQ